MSTRPLPQTRPLAATSWLWPADLAYNLRSISRWDLPIREVALLFYQCAPSLAYGAGDFEPGAGLSCHAHLPVDLPWERPDTAWDIITRLMAPPGPLLPWGGVLHPPGNPRALARIARLWRKASPDWRLLIENVPGQNLKAHWPVIAEHGLCVCLDVGHLMACNQHWLLDEPSLPGRTRLIHCYAPGTASSGHKHLALNALSARQRDDLRRIFTLLPPEVPALFEVFSESDLRASLDTFYALMRLWGIHA